MSQAISIDAENAGPEYSLTRPWPAMAASIVAICLLSLIHQDLTFVIAIVLLTSRFSNARLELKWKTWLVRFTSFAAVYFYCRSRATVGSFVLEDSVVSAFGRLCAAELALQFWRSRPEGGANGVVTLFLSALVYTCACNTGYPNHVRYIRYITPLYVFFVLLALPRFKNRNLWGLSARNAATYAIAARRGRVIRYLVMAAALFYGAGIAYGLYAYQYEINAWTMKLMSGKPAFQTVGISLDPRLGGSFESELSEVPLLRVHGHCGETHLRGMAFDEYSSGSWGPKVERRSFENILTGDLRPTAPGIPVQVTRLAALYRVLFVPLNSSGIDARNIGPLQWSPGSGGPLRTFEHYVSIPNTYTIFTSGNPFNQGVLCNPPEDVARLLKLPPEIDARVVALAKQITAGIADPLMRMQKIESYLSGNYTYSLSIELGDGDPVSEFILQKKSGHCQFFASSAVMMLRSIGIPSRYVLGLYAHESDGDDTMIVRERDAHAWAECWIEGHGWLTVEATPASGMPSQKKFSSWPSIWEFLKNLRKWISEQGWTPWVMTAALGVLIAYLLAMRGFFGKSRDRKKAGERPYSFPSPGMAALSLRFDSLLRRRGLICPGHWTWNDYIRALEAGTAHLQGERPVDSSLLMQANEFLTEYNVVRFCRPGDQTELNRLNALLSKLEM